ncbi:MAG: TolC family protein [Phycisphaerales bacterium]
MHDATTWCCGLALAGTLSGCVSPLGTLDDDTQLAETTQRQWAPTAMEKWQDANAPAAGEDQVHLPTIDEASTLGECLRYAAAANQTLEAAWHRWQAALERVPQVTALPDPRASYGYFLNEVETRVGPQKHRISLSQTLPWFGKLDLAGDIAAEQADAEFERFQAARFALFQKVHATYAELFYLRSAIELTQKNLDLLQQFEQIIRARYRVGAEGSSHPDLVRVQLELGQLEDRVQQLVQLRPTFAARFNAALNRAPDAAAPWPSELLSPLVTVDESALQEQLKARNPQLLALTAQMREQQAAAKLARKSAYPDITLNLDYTVTGEAAVSSMNESGDDAMMAGFSINLPIWREKYDAAVRESLRKRLATASQRQATESELLADMQQAIFNYRDAQRRIALYRNTLIPKAEESLNATLRAYQAATLPFLDLLDAERTLLELQLNQQRAVADGSVAVAMIEMLIAEALPLAGPDVGDES